MQMGMIGLGRMGANMTRRLLRGGHDCVVYDADPGAVAAIEADGALGAASISDLVVALKPPRKVWMMIPVDAVDSIVGELTHLLAAGDVLVDGGNSHYGESVGRATSLASHGIRFVDVGTSGGVVGLERGYCLMAGGESGAIAQLAPIFETLAPGHAAAPRTSGRAGEIAPEERGWLHCGPSGAGHFAKMIHNGIEYALMASYAEGFAILRTSGFDFDVSKVAELWRRGSVVSSWLLDLTAAAMAADPGLDAFEGRVGDSGEGRWTVQAAIDQGVPAHVITAALYERFSSRGAFDFGGRVLSAMRHQFGGHAEPQTAPATGDGA